MLELNDPGSGAACVDALFARADADFSARRMSDASNAYLTVLAERPHDAHALHRLALASVHLEDMNAAQTYIERAVLAAPERAELWEHAGLIAALKGEPIIARSIWTLTRQPYNEIWLTACDHPAASSKPKLITQRPWR
jgi:Flp pilus assembly protein TadD